MNRTRPVRYADKIRVTKTTKAGSTPIIRDITPLTDHQEALNETGEAYSQFHGWELACLWCPVKVRAKTKREALTLLREHYDQVAPGHGGIT